MEYKLNKIDTELRQKVKNITKKGKIHKIKHYKINTDEKEKREKMQYKNRGKKRFLIDATKDEKIEVQATKNEYDNRVKGKFLDVRE